MFRTHTCGQLTKEEVGTKVTLSGWVNGRRDHGGLIFIDLRDHYGLTQVVFDGKVSAESFAIAEKLRDEWVVKVEGEVVARPANATNKHITTGEIELHVTSTEILNSAQTPPFKLAWEPGKEENTEDTNEDLRLKYRFLDLRRKKMQDNLVFRAKVVKYLRDWMHEHQFNEIETPILTVSSPEGARDFLVPSRLHPGKFYALPQAPQQYKQLLMVAGMDKYFQVAPCMRDEDARADRSPGEFYQLDVETSFLTQDEFFALMEPLFIDTTKQFTDKKIMQVPFPRIPFREAMLKYGCDKPDLRFGMEIQETTELFKDCGFAVFNSVIAGGGVIRALVAPGGATFSKSDIEKLNDEAKKLGGKGLASILIETTGAYTSIITKFLGEELTAKIVATLGAKAGDAIFLCADKEAVAAKVMGQVRLALANKLNLIDKTKMAYCWIVDFPMFEYNEENKKIDFGHNPFSMPQGGMDALLNKDPLDILAYQYDIVLNGVELSSGAVRNNVPEIMYKAFEIAGYTDADVDAKFGHMIAAFKYGAPPHCGFAPGIERYVMLLRDEPSIREITAFPKNGRAEEPMVGSPAEVSEKQLKELHISLEDIANSSEEDETAFNKIKEFLDQEGIKYEVINHKPVFTSKQAAKVRGTDLKQGARAIIFKTENGFIQVVCPADKNINEAKVQKVSGAKELVMASEKELKEATGCGIGAIPPFGGLFGFKVYADGGLAENELIAFNAGMNTRSIKMKYQDWEKSVKPIVGDFS